MASDCTNPRVIDNSGVPDVTAEKAWAELVTANADNDLDDFRAVSSSLAFPLLVYFLVDNMLGLQDVHQS